MELTPQIINAKIAVATYSKFLSETSFYYCKFCLESIIQMWMITLLSYELSSSLNFTSWADFFLAIVPFASLENHPVVIKCHVEWISPIECDHVLCKSCIVGLRPSTLYNYCQSLCWADLGIVLGLVDIFKSGFRMEPYERLYICKVLCKRIFLINKYSGQ